ncbi:hypothetical protein TNCV_1658921 [Trichonephila clavipes]|nr:hypothetical protein TNCV_1658921 [Trichonephila clavipes]
MTTVQNSVWSPSPSRQKTRKSGTRAILHDWTRMMDDAATILPGTAVDAGCRFMSYFQKMSKKERKFPIRPPGVAAGSTSHCAPELVVRARCCTSTFFD